MRQYVSNEDCAAAHVGRGCLMHSTQRLRLGVSSKETERLRLRHQRSEQAWDVLMWLCAAAGTAWLLQFIEDMQQSRAFHETCEQTLPEWQAAKIPEVRSAYWYLQCAAPNY